MHRVTKIPVILLNPMLTCRLCDGYLIDATTIIECLHSFCRSCLLKYLENNTNCPICDTLLHKTKPHYAIRSDRALQAIVYKLIPSLFEREMSCRRDFFKDHNDVEHVRSLSPEKRGEITLSSYVLQEEEHMSLELSLWHPDDQMPSFFSAPNGTIPNHLTDIRSIYLLCPCELTVAHLEKLIRLKFGLEPNDHKVPLFFTPDDIFNPDYTLSDLACLYSWRRSEPMKLYFTVLERPQRTSVNSSSLLTHPQLTRVNSCSNTSVSSAGPLHTNPVNSVTESQSHLSPSQSVSLVHSCNMASPTHL